MQLMRTIDVLHTPRCFIEAPEESYKEELAVKWQVNVREFNLWEIEGEDLAGLPDHVEAMIRAARDPHGPEDIWHAGGSIFFLDGEKLDLSPALKWPQVEGILQQREEPGND
jgi:hypothetical protein